MKTDSCPYCQTETVTFKEKMLLSLYWKPRLCPNCGGKIALDSTSPARILVPLILVSALALLGTYEMPIPIQLLIFVFVVAIYVLFSSLFTKVVSIDK